jgi:peroxiredoxin
MVTDYGVRRDDVPGYSGMARRTIFIVDRDGVIRWTWVASREQPQPDYDAVVREAKRIAGGA